jgi:hypothetical protein
MKGGEPLTFSATGRKEETMEKFKESCEVLFDNFDSICMAVSTFSPKREDPEIGLSLTNYLIECTPELQKLVDDSLPVEFWNELVHLSFGLGFVLGMITEPTYPKTKEAIKNIKQTMKEEQLLPYLPRETSQTPSKQGLNSVKQGL